MGFSGALPYFNDAVAGTVQGVKAQPAQIRGMRLVNTTAATAYLQIFDAAAANVTVGTTTAFMTVRLGANESLAIQLTEQINTASGLSLAGTTTATGSTGAAISVLMIYE